MMADIPKIKRNIQRMIDQGAPEADIDAYVASEGTTPEALRSAQPAAPAPGMAMDAAKGFGTGLGQGAISGLGMMGDAAQRTQEWTQSGLEAIGVPQDYARMGGQAMRATMGPFAKLPTSGQATKAIENYTGPFYQAQTTPGQYAQTLGQFIPGMAAGPGSMPVKIAGAVGGALGSETAGQMTRGSKAEPYARLAGALLSGSAAMATRRGAALKTMRKAAPTAEEAKLAANRAYTDLENAGIHIPESDHAVMMGAIANEVEKYNPTLAPHANALLTRMQDATARGGDVPFRTLERFRQDAGGIVRGGASIERADRSAAGKIIDAIDRSLAQTGGTENIKAARELARRNILVSHLDEMGRKSEHYVSGAESGLRNQYASYLRSQKGKGLTAMEEAALQKVVRREGIQNVLTTAGGRLNLVAAPAVAFVKGTAVGGPLVGAAYAAAAVGGHLAARKGMELFSRKAANDALKTILAGKTAQQTALAGLSQARRKTFLNALLAAQASRINGQSSSGDVNNPQPAPYSLSGR